ncbi:MAG: amino acid ABC transporter permease [Candidatus Limnocylindria bacterium]
MSSSPSLPPGGPRVAPWRDVRVIRVAAQVLVVGLVGLLVAYLLRNLLSAMDDRGLGFGFRFLDSTAGFEIRETPIPYSATDTYGKAFLVGLLNTLFVSAVGIVLATLLGFVVGVARLSRNFLVNRVTAGYVEVIRNTPLLVQLFFLYAFLLQLPGVADSVTLPGGIFLNQRGLSVPAPFLGPTFGLWVAFVAAGLLIAIVARRFLPDGRRWIGLLAIVVVPLAGWIAVGEAPIGVDVPVLQRFNFTGGMTLSSGFTALLVGLVLYTAAFIGEVVRGGILAVRRGQVEAARALGLSEGHILRLVVFPQALRVIVPPLTSQYLNLAKNSSLAIAIGYPDLFSVSQTMANQTGQPVSVIAMVMGTYLSISLVTSLLMNLYNRRVQVLER